MQDIHSIAGGSRLFGGGGGGGGDRRLRPHLHHHHQNHQALKCPRCDSLNTKFCYYNNYNLSQPRHFCKSCRRYWTKGGVLRNVPVGGGCRKTKRSSSKSKSTADAVAPPPLPPSLRERKSTSDSSSESSSLTATTATTATATEAVSAPSSNSLLSVQDTKLFPAPSTNPNFEGGIFSEIGSFTSLITSSNDTLAFGFGNMADVTTTATFAMNQPFQNQAANEWAAPPPQTHRMMNVNDELKMQQEITGGGYMDQTAQVDPSGRSSNIGFGPLDWQPNGDHHQVLFDLPTAVDQAYWSQNQWTDQDHSNLYLP